MSIALLFAVGCATAKPAATTAPTAQTTRPRVALGATVYRSVGELGALAARLPPGLDLSTRVLVLPGGWVPPRVRRVTILDVDEGAPHVGTGVERVDVSVVGGALHVAFVHDANESGWCCAGVRPIDPTCRSMPPMPERPADSDEVDLLLYRAPRAAAEKLVVKRTLAPCGRP